MIQTCPIIQLSVDPSLALMYDEPTDELAEVLIDDVARIDGIVSDVQTKVNTAGSDIVNINVDISNLESKDVLHEDRLDDLETADVSHAGRLDSLEANDSAATERIDTLETEIDLNTAKISFDSTSSAKLATVEEGATADQTPSEIKSAYESNTNTNVFTDTEKSKLASLEDAKFLGTYINTAALISAHPSAIPGSYAYVDAGEGDDVTIYI
jgi:hypothetical protein